jgi:hypothetical protein
LDAVLVPVDNKTAQWPLVTWLVTIAKVQTPLLLDVVQDATVKVIVQWPLDGALGMDAVAVKGNIQLPLATEQVI